MRTKLWLMAGFLILAAGAAAATLLNQAPASQDSGAAVGREASGIPRVVIVARREIGPAAQPMATR